MSLGTGDSGCGDYTRTAAVIFPPLFFSGSPFSRRAVARFPARNGRHRSRDDRRIDMNPKPVQTAFAVELAAQIVLAAAIGLFVGVALSGAVLLLAS
jgi:hypothetical protein